MSKALCGHLEAWYLLPKRRIVELEARLHTKLLQYKCVIPLNTQHTNIKTRFMFSCAILKAKCKVFSIKIIHRRKILVWDLILMGSFPTWITYRLICNNIIYISICTKRRCNGYTHDKIYLLNNMLKGTSQINSD